MKNLNKENKENKMYCKYSDPSFLGESFECSKEVGPNDNCVTDADILSGKIAPSYQGTYAGSIKDGVHPLHRRGVDFTDLGNILASIDSQEERTTQHIAQKRAELETQKTE